MFNESKSHIIFFLLFCSICFPFQEKPNIGKAGTSKSFRHLSVWEDKFITEGDINAAFVSNSSPDLDTLVFGRGGAWFNIGASSIDKYFFLLTRDSLNKQIIVHGIWNYEPYDPHSGSDCGHIVFNAVGLGELNCKACVRIALPPDTTLYPNEVIRTVTIDTIFKSPYAQKEFLRNSAGKPYMFQSWHIASTKEKK
jgi:hypothetical protein